MKQLCYCKHCGKEFVASSAVIARGGGVYCSFACHMKRLNPNWCPPPPPRHPLVDAQHAFFKGVRYD